MELEQLIRRHAAAFGPMFEPALTSSNTVYMDLSNSGQEFEDLDDAALDAAVFDRIADAGAIAGVGGYLENRSVYASTELFQGDRERCIHIGVDVFMPAGTPVYAPLDGVVHSFANRQVEGDYGPVIILAHELDGVEFHSLYGHLEEASLDGLRDGAVVARGSQVAAIGPRPVNGDWIPHLHFQLIRDMQGARGDYPGVVRADEVPFYRVNCPDPMSLLVS